MVRKKSQETCYFLDNILVFKKMLSDRQDKVRKKEHEGKTVMINYLKIDSNLRIARLWQSSVIVHCLF